MAKAKQFFTEGYNDRPEDELARQQDVEALLAPRPVAVQNISVERIEPNPYQARKDFDNLEGLALVIKLQGFTSRLRVRPHPTQLGFFQLVYGERRLRAAKEAGLTSLPCDVAEYNDAEMVEIGLAENIQRKDLDPVEEAQAFQTFIRERGYSIRSLAEKIGKNKGYVENRLALLKTPEDVQNMVLERNDTVRAAREIAKLPTSHERQPLIEGILSGKLNTVDVAEIVRETTKPSIVVPPTHGNIQNHVEERGSDNYDDDDDDGAIISFTMPSSATVTNLGLPALDENETSITPISNVQAATKKKSKINSEAQQQNKIQHEIERDATTILSILAKWYGLELTLVDKDRFYAHLTVIETKLAAIKEKPFT